MVALIRDARRRGSRACPPSGQKGANIHAGVSMDQIAAQEFRKATQLASMELTTEAFDLAGNCAGYSCAYNATVSWRTATTPLPMEANPRAVFERLFGASETTDLKARLVALRRNRSVLDAMADKISALQHRLGSSDRVKLTGYLEAVRDVERRIQKAEEQSDRELPRVEKPMGTPSDFMEHGKLLLDLQALAFQTDLTRVFTFAVAQEQSTRTYPEIGVFEPHHPVSHHGNMPDKLALQAKINSYHLTLFGYFLEKLRSIPGWREHALGPDVAALRIRHEQLEYPLLHQRAHGGGGWAYVRDHRRAAPPLSEWHTAGEPSTDHAAAIEPTGRTVR